MYGATGRTSPTRFAVVSVLMLLVLLGSVGIAWWLVRRHPATRGERILARVRKAGLAAYFPGTSDHWMLRYGPSDEVIGWQALFIRTEEDGQFRGLDVAGFQPPAGPPRVHWEQWQLDGSATQGQYVAGQLLSDRVRWYLARDTSIRLEDGHLTVQQRPLGQVIDTEAPAPDNYIPEGMVSRICLQVARDRTRAQFQYILNSKLPHKLPRGYSTLPPFVTVRIRYVPRVRRKVAGAATAAVAAHLEGSRPVDQFTYVFDEKGKTLAILRETDRGPLDDLASTWAQVQEKFPSAAEQLRSLSKMLKFPLPKALTGSGEGEPDTRPDALEGRRPNVGA